MKNAIVVRDVTKTYAEGGSSVAALRGVNLEVESGEIVMLMGPSGSGKTTLLSIMGCILQASPAAYKSPAAKSSICRRTICLRCGANISALSSKASISSRR